MPTTIDHVLFAVLAAAFPLWAALFGTRRLRRAAPGDVPRARLWLYRRAIVIQWTLTLGVLALWSALDRSRVLLGVVPLLTPGLFGVAAGVVIVTIAILRERASALADDETLAKVRDRLGRLEIMLPHSPQELRWFYALSITAGICEEVLYRGYLIWYLGNFMNLIPAVVVAGVFFGIGHAYQGVRGVLVTAAVGVFLGAVFAITGSLYAGMVIHALMDAHSGHLGFVALSRGRSELDDAIARAGMGELPGPAEESDEAPEVQDEAHAATPPAKPLAPRAASFDPPA